MGLTPVACQLRVTEVPCNANKAGPGTLTRSRRCSGGRHGFLALGNSLHWSGASIVFDGLCCRPGCMFAPPPKFGFRFLQATTSCGSICGKGLVACLRCGAPAMMGRMQSSMIPMPMLAPLGTKPAWRHAALIWAHGLVGADSSGADWTGAS